MNLWTGPGKKVVSIVAGRKLTRSSPYPKISGSRVKVKLDLLLRGANANLAEVLGVVLLILGRNRLVVVVRIVGMFLGSPNQLLPVTGVAAALKLLGEIGLLQVEEPGLLGGVEAVASHCANIGLGAIEFMAGLANSLNLVEAKFLTELGLDLVHRTHGD